MKYLPVVWVGIAFCFGAYAVDFPQYAAGPRTGTVWRVETVVTDPVERAAMLDGAYDVAGVSGARITLYVTEAELDALKARGLPVTLIARQPAPPLPEDTGAKGVGKYHSYATLTSDLEDYRDDYPGICRLVSIGKSVEGRDLWAMLITDNPDVVEDEPETKFVGAIHGDEVVAEELCVYLIDYLLKNYGKVTRVTNLVNSTAIWVMPLMNPDGFEAGTRYNADGYDLNRSFPEYPSEYAGTYYGGEPLGDAGRPMEVGAMMRWTVAHHFVLSANFHCGAVVFNYPYDEDGVPSGVDAPSPDDALFRELGRRYASCNPAMWNSTEFTHGISNGSAWYVVFGGMQDWNYRYAGCNEVTIEISDARRPAASTLSSYWNNNRDAMLAYLESAQMGVRGSVTDGRTHEPVAAEITVEGNTQPVHSGGALGAYSRMLLPGTYTLHVSALGYLPQTWRNVVVADGAAARIDAALLDADVNDDGAVDAADVQTEVNALLGLPVAYPADLDGDGLSATDLQMLINALLTGTG